MPALPKNPLVALAAFCLLFSGCAVMDGYQKSQSQRRADRAAAAVRAQALIEHTAFRAEDGWKKKTYRNKALMAQAIPTNVSIEISLDEQRGLLLVNGAIAMDFPVATGKKSHPTPAGKFTVRAKEKDYRSNLYGTISDSTGVVLVDSADSRTDLVPEGGSFSGASMPFWMRLTDTGVGLHVGYVPGRPASHGCVRLKRETAATLFGLVKIGTPVEIADRLPAVSVK